MPALFFEQAHRQPNDMVRDDAARRPEGVRRRDSDERVVVPRDPYLQEPRRDGTGGDNLSHPQASRRDETGGNNLSRPQDLPIVCLSCSGSRNIDPDELANSAAIGLEASSGHPQASRRDETGGNNPPQDLPRGCLHCLFASNTDPVGCCGECWQAKQAAT